MTRAELQAAAELACESAMLRIGRDSYGVIVVVTRLAAAPGERSSVGLASNLTDAAALRTLVQLGAGLAGKVPG